MLVVRIAVGLLVLAHGLVHLLYLAPDVPEFSAERSWLVPDAARRPTALLLVAITVITFALVTLAVWGVPGLSSAWSTVTVVACLSSMTLLILFWSPQLVLGLVIDLALLTVAVVQPGWLTRIFPDGG